MLKEFFQKHKFDFLAVAIFLAISCIYFYPALQGYSLKMGDITNYSGMAKETFDYEEANGESTLWTGTNFGGMPTYMIGAKYTNPLKSLQAFVNSLLTFPIMAVFLAFISFYILAKSFNAGFFIALIGALAYGLSTYNFTIIEAGHTGKMMAIAYMPGVIGGIIMMLTRKKWLLPFGITALFMSLELLVNHVQMTYYFGFIIIAVMIAYAVRYVKKGEANFYLKRAVLVGAALGVGVFANFANYYNVYKFSKKTMRGKPVISISANAQGNDNRTDEQKSFDTFNQTSGLKRDYITQWSYGKSETINLFISKAKGKNDLVNEVIEKIADQNPQSAQFIAQQSQKTRGKVFGGYWGNQPFTGGPNYIGAIVVFLALMYLFFVHTPLKWAMLGVSILTIMLSWGINLGGSIENMWLTNFFIDYIPLYSKFRAVSSMLVVVNLLFPTMAVLFLVYLSKNISWAQENIKKLSIGAGVVIMLLLIIVLSPDSVGLMSDFEQNYIDTMQAQFLSNPRGPSPETIAEQVIDARAAIVQMDALRSLGLILLSIVFLYAFIKFPKQKNFALAAIALLVFIDLFTVDKQYLNNDKNPNTKEFLAWKKGKVYDQTYLSTPGDQAIYQLEAQRNPAINQAFNQKRVELAKKKKNITQADIEGVQFEVLNFNTNYRMMDLDNPFNSARASYFHKTTGGYSPAKLKRYQDVIDFYIQQEVGYISSKLRTIQQRNPEIMKAVITGQIPLLAPSEVDRIKVLNMLNNKYFLFNGQLVWTNTYAQGNAWFVQNVKEVKDNNEEILALKDVNLTQTAIVHQEFKEVIKAPVAVDSNARIKMESYSPNHLVYSSTSNQDGLAVFSEVYYRDGWKAYIDGKEVPYARANYIVRALNIPKGEHRIEFKFESKMYHTSNTISLFAFLLILLPFGAYFFKNLRLNSSKD